MTTRAPRLRASEGFTLIELLVVVLIIGILSAIAIPIFLGQQTQAKDAAAKSDLASARIAYETIYRSSGSITLTAANLASNGFVASSGTSAFKIRSGSAESSVYCLQETSGSGAIFHLNEKGAVVTGVCNAGFTAATYTHVY